ncbi:MAG: potassium channel beta subunit family protein [Archangium sp.]
MNYRRLGKSGLKVSELSLGTWLTFGDQLDEDTALECAVAAWEGGVNFFDSAETYADGKAERVLGNILKRVGWRRESLVISTKIFWGGEGPNDVGLSHKHIVEGVNNALRRLQVEYVDLAFCHRPDPNTPIEETVRAMDLLVRQGKVFYWGTSEWSAADILKAHGLARQYGLTPPSMEQPEYNMLCRDRVEKEYLPLYAELGYGTTSWSPLALGLLTGKYNEGVPPDSRLARKENERLKELTLVPEQLAKVKRLASVAGDLGCSLAQLSLAWCLKNPNVSTVIMGASRAGQVRENLKALDMVPRLTPEVMARISGILEA